MFAAPSIPVATGLVQVVSQQLACRLQPDFDDLSYQESTASDYGCWEVGGSPHRGGLMAHRGLVLGIEELPDTAM